MASHFRIANFTLAVAALNGCSADDLRPLQQLDERPSIPFTRLSGTREVAGSRFLLAQYGDGNAAETLWIPLDAALRPLSPFVAADGYDPFVHAGPDTQIAMISPVYRQTAGGVPFARSEPVPSVLRNGYLVATAYRVRADGTLQVVPLPAANPAGAAVPDAVPVGATAVLLPAKRPPAADLLPDRQALYAVRDALLVVPRAVLQVTNIVYLLAVGPFVLFDLSTYRPPVKVREAMEQKTPPEP